MQNSRIGFLRKAAGISVAELSRRVGVSVTAASHWDHGNTFPRPDKQRLVAEALGVGLDELTVDAGLELVAEEAPQSVDDVLRSAKVQIAQALGLPVGRIEIQVRITG